MRIPEPLAGAINENFEFFLESHLHTSGLLPQSENLRSKRFLSRSIQPHLERLLKVFNRVDSEAIEKYWNQGSHPENLRLAYILGFFPSNMIRTAGVFSELKRLGFQFQNHPETPLKAIDWGSGPGSVAAGAALMAPILPDFFPTSMSWALIEQDRKILQFSESFLESYFSHQGLNEWTLRPFHRTIDWNKGDLLPKSAPQFDLWTQSFYSNESHLSPDALAERLIRAFDRHLAPEGLAVFIEPALKLESRKLLQTRKALIQLIQSEKKKYQVLLPCLGHQNCGALLNPEDWCHEEVLWWRPPYYKILDEMMSMDRKLLPFSYLIVAKSDRPIESILPGLKSTPSPRHRLVSPPHSEGRDLEFFICGPTDSESGSHLQPGSKRRARYLPKNDDEKELIWRGSILGDVQLRGEMNSTRIESIVLDND